MKNNVNTLIYWKNYGTNSYLYGTTLRFNQNSKEVYYKNIMANPGITLHSWYSQVNFQATRIAPQLPLLQHGKNYKIIVKAQVRPRNTLYLRINYYDIYDKILGYDIIKNLKGEFTYPKNSFKYTIELFSAGLSELTFSHLYIGELENNYEKLTLNNIEEDSNILNIIFVENSLNSLPEILKEKYSCFSNVLLVNDFNENLLISYLQENINWQEIKLIGYTENTNKKALYYLKIFENAKAYIFVDSNMNMPTEITNVITYSESRDDNYNIELIGKIIDFSYRLKLLDGKLIV